MPLSTGMEKNIFLDLAKTVTDKSERKRLLDFIRSPYFNLSEKVDLQTRILEMAWEWWDGGYAEYWNEVKIYPRIFGPSEAFSQARIDRLKSSIAVLMRQFFAEETRFRQQHPAEPLRWQLKYFREKENFHQYELLEKEARKVLKQRREQVSVEDMFEQYLLETEVAWLYPGENHKREEDYLSDAIIALDSFWFAARARWTCAMLNQKQRASNALDAYENFFMRIIGRIAHYGPANQTLVQLYQQASKLFEPTDNPGAVLENFLDFVEHNSSCVAPFIRDELETLACSFCVRQVHLGKNEFIQKHFDIYLRRLESKRIYKNGKILASDYLSITTTALKLPRDVVSTDWVKQFLDKHRNRLYNHEAAEEMVRYNYANYYFYIKDFKNALKNLKETYRDINFKLVSRLLEIKTRFEIDDALTDDRIEAANAFFRRERKIPPAKRAPLNLFIAYVRKLRDPRTIHNPRKLENLIETLNQEIVAERAWLLEKAKEFLNRARPKKHKP